MTFMPPVPEKLADHSPQELAQILAQRLTIKPNDWHRLKGDRQAQAQQQIAAALVFLLNDNPQQALIHLQQAQGWLDRTLSAPACPDHGHRKRP